MRTPSGLPAELGHDVVRGALEQLLGAAERDADVALDCAISDYSVYDADPNVQAVLNDNGMVSTQHWGQTV